MMVKGYKTKGNDDNFDVKLHMWQFGILIMMWGPQFSVQQSLSEIR